MEVTQKISLLQELISDNVYNVSHYYETLEKCDALMNNYSEYMHTKPIDCDEELIRLPSADYRTCCALITMLLREDHF